MSYLDLDKRLIDLSRAVDLVYSPIADVKEFPQNVDVTLVEGAIANLEHLKLVKQIRERSKIVVSLGDCAVTGNVTSLRNTFKVDELLTKVYKEGQGRAPRGLEEGSGFTRAHCQSTTFASGYRDRCLYSWLPA